VGVDAEHRVLVTRGLLALVAAAALSGGPVSAACRLALSLGLDVSSSVDAREYRLQTEGLAAALVAPEVAEAFLATPEAPVMLQIYEWSGWQQQVVRLDWTSVRGAADLARIAIGLRGQKRSFEQFPTALGYALRFGGEGLAGQPCTKRTLDLAGDGTNNDGVSPEIARRSLPVPEITINGLVIGANVETLGRYYQQFVIQGPGSFVEVARDYDDFERAMRRKLLRELGVIEMSARSPAVLHEGRPGAGLSP
jgi:hypothetical protein